MSRLSLTSFIRPFHLPFRPVFVLCGLRFSSFPSFLAFFSILVSFFLSFLLSYTDTFSATSLDEGSARQRPLPNNTQHSQYRHSCRRRDSNPQSKQASGRRPVPQIARPLNSVIISSADVKYNSIPSEPEPQSAYKHVLDSKVRSTRRLACPRPSSN